MTLSFGAVSRYLAHLTARNSERRIIDLKAEERIAFLDYLRIFAFSSVLIGHILYTYLYQFSKNDLLHITPKLLLEIFMLFVNGGAGFIVFFFVSGYIIPHVLTFEQPLSFMIRRIFRIYPLYVVAVLSEAMLVHHQLPPLDILGAQLLLIGDFFNTPLSVGGVEWTLRIEMFFYIFMAILKKLELLDAKRGRMIFVLCATTAILSQMPAFPSGGDSKGFFPMFTPFLFIGVAFWLYELTEIRLCYLITIITLVFANHYYLLALYRPTALFEHYAALGLLVFSLAWYFRTSFKATPVVVFLSNLTYSVYLFHNWFVKYLKSFFPKSELLSNALSLGSLFVCCYIFHRLIERPFNKYGRTVSLHTSAFIKG